ncbi:hypothetical protein BGZ76_006321 [Entomortierella beljakovae]|nr:hypothetical protein BGZ76_006321 [Entomortierella beljakovae]
MGKHLSNLHSITLINRSSPFSGVSMLDDPHLFNPIPVYSIRSLTLRNSAVPKNHLSSFWVIFQHLKVLKLIETKMENGLGRIGKVGNTHEPDYKYR